MQIKLKQLSKHIHLHFLTEILVIIMAHTLFWYEQMELGTILKYLSARKFMNS